MRIGVFYKNRKWAENWFKNFTEKLGDDAKVRIGINQISVEYGPLYIVSVRAVESSRGQKFDKAICEPCVYHDKALVNQIIVPALLSPLDVDYRFGE